MDDKLAALIQRLETATARLELLSATNNSTPFISAASSNTAGVLSKMVQEYAVVLQSVYFKLSADIDPIALQQSKLVYSALEYIGQLLQASVTCKKPVGVAHIQPLQDLISQVVALKDANRSSKLYSHLCAVADGLPALGWVVVDLPVPYILEMKDSSQFYANRVIKENKETTHVQWVQAYLALLTDLAAFVKKFHTTGLVWNPKGTDFALPSANYQAKSQPAAPVAASAPAATSAPSGAPAANPFAQLGSVSLRKVEKSEMTHKNPELRANQPVKTAEKAVKAAFSSPPKCALEGNKWAIEYQQNATLTIEPEMHHVVYVYKCINTTIEIKGKVNAVTLDACNKLGVVVNHVISTMDTINSKGIKLQVLGQVATVSIDQTDGYALFLADSAKHVQIFSAKSSEMNVNVLVGQDYVETPLAEQFKSEYVNGAWVTNAVEHNE